MVRDRSPDGLRALIGALIDATDASHVGLIVTVDIDDEPHAVYANDAALRILGATADQLIGAPSFLHIAPGDHERMREQRARRLAGEPQPTPFEVTIIRRDDGRHVPVEVGLSRVVYQGKPAAVAFMRDITERRRALEELAASERRFRRLIEAAPEAIGVLQGEHFAYVNPAFVRLLGHDDADELRRRSLRELLHPDDLALAIDRARRGYAGEPLPASAEYRAFRKDGSIVELEVSSMAIEYHGAPAMLGYVRDVTERNRARAQLVQADRLAALGTLAAGIAHEINNPLAYVMLELSQAVTQLAADRDAAGRLAPILARLEEAVAGIERVATIARDLKSFARLDPEALGPVDLRDVLEVALKLSAQEISSRARLVALWQQVPPVRANATRLGQVFVNLLVNAAHAIPEGNPTANRITVKVRDGGSHAIVEVADSGVGISPEDRARIFDPFFTTKPSGVGTGLGLSVCHAIVTSVGGELTVDSELGEGSAFRVTIPYATAPAEAPPAPATAPVRATAATRPRVLVVDDEAPLARALAAALADAHDVEIALTGEKALAKLAAKRFDVVLCDLMMADVSGIDLHEEIARRDPALANRFVFMTGGAFTARATAFLTHTRNPRLEKPFDLDEVVRVIAECARRG